MSAETDRTKLSVAEVAEQAPAEFRQLLGRLHARYRTSDFAAALALVNRIAEAAEEADHHPDLDLRWGRVDVALNSHDVGGLTERDVRLATTIATLAAEAGATPDIESLQTLELALDTADADEVQAFWAALLGYRPDGDEVADSSGVGPTLWFQSTDAHDVPRQRFHLDVWVPVDQGEARVRAAVDAGGTLVDDAQAPSFWVLADAQGNRACVCTVAQR